MSIHIRKTTRIAYLVVRHIPWSGTFSQINVLHQLHNDGNSLCQFTSTMKLFRRRHSRDIPRSPSPQSVQPEDVQRKSVDFLKRRVTLNLSILDRPLMTDTDFVVDARYRSLQLIGSGSYGIVVRAVDSVTGHLVAIKKILNAFANSRMARHVLREVRLLRQLDHPRIIKLLDIDVPRFYRGWDEVYIVTPLLWMDLRSAMKNGLVKDEKVQKKISYQLLSALAYLHSRGIMHRDIKASNILLDKDFNVQICDLGEARFYSRANDQEHLEGPAKEAELTGGISTVIQSAPEITLGGSYDAAMDVWAAGCVIAELVRDNHEPLFDRVGRGGHVQEIVDVIGWPEEEVLKKMPEYAKWYMKRIRPSKGRLNELMNGRGGGLVQKMLKFDAAERCSAREVMQMEWFDEVREDEMEIQGGLGETEPAGGVGVKKLKELVWEEVLDIHPEAREWRIR